jgi:hypothetical protein
MERLKVGVHQKNNSSNGGTSSFIHLFHESFREANSYNETELFLVEIIIERSI